MSGFFRAKRRQFQRTRLRRQLAKATGDRVGPLREFVYLDDVSLYSLFTSRIGPLAETYTELQADALRSSVEASAGAGSDLVAKASIRASMEGTRTSSREVLRQATVQSTFRDFREHVHGTVVPATTSPKFTAAPRTAAELTSALASPDGTWSIGTEAFARGALVEFDVTLQAQDAYAIAAVADAVGGAVRTVSGLADNSVEVLAQADQVSALIRELLVGLVPLEGELTDWVAVDVDGQPRLVHRGWIEGLNAAEKVEVTPVRLAGMAEYPLFWRDIRRVAFADQTFRVLARVARPGIARSWNPLKITDVLARLGGEAMKLDSSMLQPAGDVTEGDGPGLANRGAAHAFVEAVRQAQHEGPLDEQLVTQVDTVSASSSWATTEEQIATFDHLLTVAVSEPDAVDREVVADARRAALARRAELMAQPSHRHRAPDPASPTFIEVEFIAIYW
jgi:hypothetical protein